MAGQSLTALLNKYHDKLNQHTTEIKDIQHDLEVLQHSVSELSAKIDKADESSGLRAALHDWIESFKELM